MIMTPKRRHNRIRKVKYRRKLLSSFGTQFYRTCKGRPFDPEDGFFENNNIMNRYIYRCRKTRTKNAGYRHKGLYGSGAYNYSGHDMKIISKMNQDEDDYYGRKYRKRIK